MRDDSSPAWHRSITTVVANVVQFPGAVLLHLWTCHLIYQHGGVFWTIVAFLSPVFAEIVVIPFVFWWGVWFQVLASIACAAAYQVRCFATLGDLTVFDIVRRRFAVWAVVMYVSLGGFCFYGVRHAIRPNRLSGEQKREAVDVIRPEALSDERKQEAVYATWFFCKILNDASIGNVTAADLVAAKDRMRKWVANHNAAEIAEVKRHTFNFLRVRILVEKEVRTYLVSDAGSDRRFSASAEAQDAFARLPEPLREGLVPLKDAASALERTFPTKRPLPRDAISVMDAQLERQWQVMEEVYLDLLKTPMPTREELLAPTS